MLLLFIVLFFLSFSPAQAAESITSFASDITINQDTSVLVQETINYQTTESKHGIYRYIPIKHNVNGLNYSIGVDLQSITDATGKAYQVKESYESGNIQWRIGDPDRTFTGKKNYLIQYLLSDVIRQFDDYDELYLDIVGEGWSFPIESSQATIHSPHAAIEDIRCFSGVYGSDDKQCRAQILSPYEAIISYNQPISYGQNVSVALKLDQNSTLVFPTQWERKQKWLLDNLWILIVPLPILLMLYLWYTRGRDYVFISPNIFDMTSKPEKLKPLFSHERTPMVYQPLSQLTPGEAGAIIDEKVDNRDIVAEIIDLARKKYLKIVPVTSGKSIFQTKDYVFTKLKEADDRLPQHQSYLLQKIFKKSDQTKLSKLKGSFYTTMNKTRQMIFDSARSKKLFTSHPQKTTIGYGVVMVMFLGIVLILASLLAPPQSPLPYLVTIFQFILVPFFAKSMVQKSAIGNNYYLQAKGLRETIRRGAWREKIHEKHLFIDEVLPFAISFNVLQKLTKDMEALHMQAPEYLAASGWSSTNFANSLNHFGTHATRTLAYNPSSSGTSGGSGFSGGSSGGGFSGGGGGSW